MLHKILSFEPGELLRRDGEHAACLKQITVWAGAVIVGRPMYEAADHWPRAAPFAADALSEQSPPSRLRMLAIQRRIRR
jgi:hypothetical protein